MVGNKAYILQEEAFVVIFLMFVAKCIRIELECVPRDENQQPNYMSLSCLSINMIGRSIHADILAELGEVGGLTSLIGLYSCYYMYVMLTCPHFNPDFL